MAYVLLNYNYISIKRDLAGLAAVLSRTSVTEEVPKTIIFCRTKNDCSKVYCFLCKSAQNKDAVSMYHSSLTQVTKTQVQDNFKCGAQLRCLSATIAFGMVKKTMLVSRL